jgi:hypothetical protein
LNSFPVYLPTGQFGNMFSKNFRSEKFIGIDEGIFYWKRHTGRWYEIFLEYRGFNCAKNLL